MSEKIKIIMVASKLDVTGISTVIMNYCTRIDLSKFEITIAAGTPVAQIHVEKCKELGVTLVILPNREKESKRYYLELNKVLKSRKFDILHVHGNSATMAIELFLAWINGVKIRIPHSHNTTCMNMKLHKMLYPVFNLLYTVGFACGNKAGEWLYGKKNFYVIPNGFDIHRFKYSNEKRKELRKELGLKDEFVIGHIGRFNQQKNQKYLLDVFEEVATNNKNTHLLLVGDGPNYSDIKKLVDKHKFNKQIILYGETNNPEDIYSAIDVFVLPSIYEGLPVVLVEAQCSGLYCVISDVVTDEMNIDKHLVSVSLRDDVKTWAEKILSIPKTERAKFYSNHEDELNKYEITNTVKYLEKLYYNLKYQNPS